MVFQKRESFPYNLYIKRHFFLGVGGLSAPGDSKPEADGTNENIEGEAEQVDTDQSPEDAMVANEITTMQEYVAAGRFRPEEINSKITLDRLKV
ncbi:hypothetical protein Y032_0137g2043 [Ancylostoma ceylanicum]|uniref:Uncharacterized protein n=1 Tax=Ancylostoma ceylanicum TaxID=53326 RepID=A0A016T519_9BILA|nr:hypothetical protein Y032_0137g2043 [Ancylostoma ceylanicum]